ncbi:MAG TPA: flagellar basal-body MS-ring/collar protein FliF [Solirubrobacteraceae bacterium]|jgi:flagellar M-ring protein FliF|nr:flagellar basal-body MS-ring/collar protein FliF [Solirubrobacteraceae bacterium]
MPTALQQMPAKSKAILAASTVGILLVAIMLFRVAAAPSYTTLRTGLDPADTGKLTAALDQAGIGYELQNNGTALEVEKAKTAQAQVALAEAGMGGGGKQPGYELLKDQKLGASDFQQRQTYQRALEGELANTIGEIDGVSDAQVRLTLPDDELFADEAKPATAAVLLQGGDGIEATSVKGIANLVASSVEGLEPENVTITDGTGRMVWPTGGEAGAGVSAATKTAAEGRYAAQVESSINALLMRTVGTGKAQVKVTADLDVDQVKQKQLKYDRTGTPVEEVEETEQLEGGAGGAGGARAGTRANIPTYEAAGGAGAGQSNYRKRSVKTTTAVGKTIIDSVRAPGTVNRMDVALVLDESLKPREAELSELVSGAAGLQEEERGDRITTTVLPFAEQPKAAGGGAAGPLPAQAVDLAKYGALGFASLVFLFFVGRHLRRREDEALMGEPQWLRQIEAPQSLSQLEAAQAGAGGVGAPVAAGARQTVEETLRRDPEKVAHQVRSWLSEDM